MERLKQIKNAYSILAVCLMITGMVLLLRPDTALSIMCRICGGVLIMFGIVKLLGYFSRDMFQLAFQFDFAMGVISCVIGLGMLLLTSRMIQVMSACIGIFMLIDALLKIQTAMDARKFGIDKWWCMFLVSLTVAVIGVLLLVAPIKGTGLVMRLIGLNLCIDGILNLLIVQSTVKSYKRIREWDL